MSGGGLCWWCHSSSFLVRRCSLVTCMQCSSRRWQPSRMVRLQLPRLVTNSSNVDGSIWTAFSENLVVFVALAWCTNGTFANRQFSKKELWVCGRQAFALHVLSIVGALEVRKLQCLLFCTSEEHLNICVRSPALPLNVPFYTCISWFWLRNYNWNAVKHHRQWNITSSHSQDVVTKVIDTLRAQMWKNIPPVNDLLFIFKTKLLLIKVVRESFSFVSNNM